MKEKVIMVICEPTYSKNFNLNYELIGKANELIKENNAKVIAVLIGSNEDEYINSLSNYGAENIIFYKSDNEKSYKFYSKVIYEICKKYNSELMLFSGTDLGKGMATTVGTKLGAGIIADCINIQIHNEKKYCFERAAINSTIIAQIVCEENCYQICTVKQNIFKSSIKEHEDAKPVIEYFKYEDDSKYCDLFKLISQKEVEKFEDVDLKNAKLIFAVGRGVNESDIEKVKEIAKYYKAEFGGTRFLVDNEVIRKERQIGQSGITINPELYIAFGISGASQHIVGIKNSKIIVAINNDSDAPIFQYADYGILADSHEIIDKLYLKIKED